MQYSSHDYSEGEPNNGCCLHCSDSEPGCLCLKCKCTKCYWYCSPQEAMSEKGYCEKVSKEMLRQKYIEESRKNAIFFRKEREEQFGKKIFPETIKVNPQQEEDITI